MNTTPTPQTASAETNDLPQRLRNIADNIEGEHYVDLESFVDYLIDPLRLAADRIAQLQADLAAALVDARKKELTDEDVRRGTMVFFMWLAGDIVRSNDSLDAWNKCMRKAIEAATKEPL